MFKIKTVSKKKDGVSGEETRTLILDGVEQCVNYDKLICKSCNESGCGIKVCHVTVLNPQISHFS